MSSRYQTIPASGWKKIESYIVLTADYVVACPSERRCEIGMGLYLFKNPRGEHFKFSGEAELMVMGAGGLYVRVVDGRGPCEIGYALKNARPLSWTFPTG